MGRLLNTQKLNVIMIIQKYKTTELAIDGKALLMKGEYTKCGYSLIWFCTHSITSDMHNTVFA